jgi:hypothetical protein
MTHQTVQQMFQVFEQRLAKKGYNPFPSPIGLHLSMAKHTTFGLWIPVVTDGLHSTDDPATMFRHTQEWALSHIGNLGGGVLLFLYNQPSAAAVEDIQKFGDTRFFAGVHDLQSGRHWLSNTLGFEQELYDDP